MLTIIRGLPGAGKSTLGRKLAADSGALFLEPDMFVTSDTQYCYTEKRYQFAVNHVRKILSSLSYCDWTGENMIFTPDVIYADVLPTLQDVNRLLEVCGQNKVKMFTLEISLEEARGRNIHNVREKDLLRMAETFEKLKIENGRAVRCI